MFDKVYRRYKEINQTIDLGLADMDNVVKDWKREE